MNKIYNHSSEDMHELPDESVHLIVTSPPYNAGIKYDGHDDNMPFDEYRSMLRRVWKECFRVLCDGGRIAINVNDMFRTPCIPLDAFVTMDMIDLGYLMRGHIVWNKGASVGGSAAWGTWMSASNPTLRGVYEHILVFSKVRYDRKGTNSTMTNLEFCEYTKDLWYFESENAARIGHPAPFPAELPRRLIQLYSFKDDLILDPFMGSGTTAVAAKELGRQYIGYDTSEKYVNLANERLRQEMLF